jgi:hypothetical protein
MPPNGAERQSHMFEWYRYHVNAITMGEWILIFLLLVANIIFYELALSGELAKILKI